MLIVSQQAISELPFASMQNHSYENVLPLQLYFHANQSHFHMKGFARTLVLTQKYEVTRKWPMIFLSIGVSPLQIITGQCAQHTNAARIDL